MTCGFWLRLLALPLLFAIALPAGAQTTRTWTGAVDDRWSVAGNWDPSGAPVSGDSLVFPAGAANTTTTNDLPAGTAFARIEVTSWGWYWLGGNGIVLTESLHSAWSTQATLPIDVGANAVTFSGNLALSGALSGTGPVLVDGDLALSSVHDYAGTLTVQGSLQLEDADLSQATLVVGGYLRGGGSVGSVDWSGPGIFLDTGRLDAADFAASGWGDLRITINGGVPGLSQGQLRVNGGVQLGTGKYFDLYIHSGFAPVPGQELVLIDNDGSDPIDGFFWNLPEGAIVTHNDAQLQVSYVGGDGNDFSLTCISAPKVWNGSINGLWSVPGNWTPAGAPVVGDSLRFLPGTGHRSTSNDLPADTAFSRIDVLGSGYTLSGNRIELTEGFSGRWDTQINLPIDVADHAVTFSGGATMAGELSGTGPVSVNSLTLSGSHSFSGLLTVGAELTLAEASLPAASIKLLGSLYGDGSVGALDWQGWGLAPYSGRIEAASLVASGSGSLHIEIDGSNPGIDHGQLRVHGSVDIGTSKQMVLAFSGNFAPVVGQEWILIDNQGSDPIVGEFSNLAEGTILLRNGAELLVSYAGGDGNDLSLTCISAPRYWNGSVGPLWSQPGNWTPNGVPVAGDYLRFPETAQNRTSTNDLSAGTVLSRIEVVGHGYALGGNRIELTEQLNAPWGTVIGFPLDVAAHPVTITGGPRLTGPMTGTGSVLVQSPVFAGAHGYSGEMTVLESLYLDEAELRQADVLLEGSMYGRGAVGAVVWNGYSIYLWTELIETGDLTASGGGPLSIRVEGTVPGQSHGQLRVDGTVDLGSQKILSLSLDHNLNPQEGQEWVLIDNDGADPVLGAFANHPEGSIITHNGAHLRLSYAGGDGNDISLLCISAPRRWTGAVSGLWSVPGNWSPAGAPQAGEHLYFGNNAQWRDTLNDLPAGTAFSRVDLAGSSYVLSGNRVEITERLDSSHWWNLINLPIDVSANAVEIYGSGRLAGELSGTGPVHVHGNMSIEGVHSYSGNLTIGGGLGLYDADVSQATLAVSGQLSGGGAVGSVNWTGGTIRPEDRRISTRDFAASGWGNFYLDLAGVIPGVSLGALEVNGAVELGDSKELSVFAAWNFVPAIGHEWVLIENDGNDPVSGHFASLPEGATLNRGGFNYRISYAGGDGNDVSLTSLDGRQPTSTSLVAMPGASQPGQWVTLTATVTGGDLVPSGPIVFRDGRDEIGIVYLDVSGTAVLTTANLQPGRRSITAEYRGGPNHGASASAALTQTVGTLHTLTYSAGANGSLVGSSMQQVIEGLDGSPVAAVPDLGYSFLQWSDASTDNPRTDTNVTGSLNVEAQFALIPDTVELQVAKESGLLSALDGQVVVYAITVANAGPVAASGAQLSDVLPAELVEGEWACLQDESNTACPASPFDAGSGDLYAEIDLPVGGFLRYDLSARIQAGGAAAVSNTASVAPPAGMSDLDLSTNSATDSILIAPQGIFSHGFEPGPAALTVPAAAKAQREAAGR